MMPELSFVDRMKLQISRAFEAMAREKEPKKRVGLYGGSFNPPHYGHFIAAFYARHFLDLDEVWMMVTPGSPLKDPASYAALEDRLRWCKMIAKDHPWLIPTDIEKDFYTAQTIDTLQEMNRRFPKNEFVWIMGADNLANFHEWNRWQDIIDNFPIAILARPGDGDEALKSEAARYAAALKVDNPKDMNGRNNGWCFIDTPGIDISASGIVKDLQAGHRNIRDLWPGIENDILRIGAYDLPKTIVPKLDL